MDHAERLPASAAPRYFRNVRPLTIDDVPFRTPAEAIAYRDAQVEVELETQAQSHAGGLQAENRENADMPTGNGSPGGLLTHNLRPHSPQSTQSTDLHGPPEYSVLSPEHQRVFFNAQKAEFIKSIARELHGQYLQRQARPVRPALIPCRGVFLANCSSFGPGDGISFRCGLCRLDRAGECYNCVICSVAACAECVQKVTLHLRFEGPVGNY